MIIPELIPEQGFELIRDAIGSILVTEFANQILLQTDPEVIEILNTTNVFKERLSAIGSDENFVVCPILFSSSYDNQSLQDADGTNIFFIDCYGRGKQNDLTPLDQVSAIRLQRLIGIIRYIFEHPTYIRLGFAPGFIIQQHITNIQRTQIEKQEDADNMTMYRVTISVKANEMTGGEDNGILIDQSFTDVKIGETSKGFQYLIDPTP